MAKQRVSKKYKELQVQVIRPKALPSFIRAALGIYTPVYVRDSEGNVRTI